jgi:tRNA (guanine-N7-)-methyltransferase
MTRKSFAIRHLKFSPPDEQTAGKYLLNWHARDLYQAPDAFPRITSEHLFRDQGSGIGDRTGGRPDPRSPIPDPCDRRDLELEIGCGTGEHLCALAAGAPDVNFVGIDISLKSLYIAVQRASALSLGNIKFIKAGIQLVYPLLAPESLRAVYLHYPDPCLRPKYRKRRVWGTSFLDHMHYALARGGRLSVMTDLAPLFAQMLAQVEKDPRFERIDPDPYPSAPDAGPQAAKSRYQATWEKFGIYPMRFVVRKR